MAEALGVVSSVIAVIGVAGKLGTSAFTLKRLWDEVQDVPETIQQCIDELEIMTPALKSMESEFQRTHQILQYDETAKLSLDYCQKAATRLEEMVSDMRRQIETAQKGKRTLTRFKRTYQSALMRAQPSIIVSDLKSLLERERAEEATQVRLHQDHHQNQATKNPDSIEDEEYPAELTLGQPRTEKEWSPTLRCIPWQHSLLPWCFTYQATDVTDESCPVYISQKIRVHQARFRFPALLLQNAWDFQVYNSYHGWKFHLKLWNIRSSDSEVFTYVKTGKTDLLLEAFKAKKASLYDRDQYGHTLLDKAISASQIHLIRVLSRMGLKLSDISLMLVACGMVTSRTVMARRMVDLFRLLSEEDGLFDHLNNRVPKNLERVYMSTLKVLVWWFPEVLSFVSDKFPQFHRRVPTSWFCAIVWELVDPHLVLEIAKKSALVEKRTSPFPHLDEFLRVYLDRYVSGPGSEVEGYRALARWLFEGASPIEVAWDSSRLFGGSILCSALEIFRNRTFGIGVRKNKLLLAISAWLEDLALAGIDLEEYIRSEMATCRFETGVEIDPQNRGPTRFTPSGPSLVLLNHGPSPQDWQFEWDPCLEVLVGEFWRCVEASQRRNEAQRPMPGAWQDDDEDFNFMETVEEHFPSKFHNIGVYTCSGLTFRWYCGFGVRPQSHWSLSSIWGIPGGSVLNFSFR
ncbi:hypothetical protein EDB81DRAFT_697193 [Dactylonectria macrodidyma]|uniref:NACHT-NTPase and P-loop NTPases N-terminal domain-containing protein n=1 Tax=Dactylonectria macrodidyma TaxID=307937 RepID=A0A9P9INJ0_9HYPO|nr:hypothetical protein EDB81DRAFT_697193 [Dactylonectria macrodidyma]